MKIIWFMNLLFLGFALKPTYSFSNSALQYASTSPLLSRSFLTTHDRGSFGDKLRSMSRTHSISDSFVRVSSAATSKSDNNDGKLSLTEPKKKRKSLFITIWVHVMSIFIILNYRSGSVCTPAILGRIPFATLSLIHAISGMLFSGSIITTTIVEWIVVNNRKQLVYKFWFDNVPKVEQMVVIPALSGSIISGVGQAFTKYDSLKFAPRHVKMSIHILLLFGLWWGFTDRTTQTKAQDVANNYEEKDEENGTYSKTVLPSVFRQRRISNIVSCIFLVGLYSVMVLKPGFAEL